MNLSRKFLKALGIEDEKIDNIIEAHLETVNAIKEERDGYQKQAQTLETVQKELDELKAKGDDGYKAKYEEEKNAHEALKEDIARKECFAVNEKIYRNILEEAGVKHKYIATILEAEKKAIESLSVADGKAEDHDNLINNAKTKWSDFIAIETRDPQRLDTPPKTDGVVKTTAEIVKIKDKAARLKEFEKQIMSEKGID